MLFSSIKSALFIYTRCHPVWKWIKLFFYHNDAILKFTNYFVITNNSIYCPQYRYQNLKYSSKFIIHKFLRRPRKNSDLLTLWDIYYHNLISIVNNNSNIWLFADQKIEILNIALIIFERVPPMTPTCRSQLK